jgi:YbbR domain-containing protein
MVYHPFRYLGLKVVAVCLAVMLWLTLAGEQLVERSLRVPLELQNVADQLEIMSEQPSHVDVRVRGTSGALSRLQPGDVVAVLDLRAARPGHRLFHLNDGNVKTPFGVFVSQVMPATVPLELERSVRRQVPVRPVIEGDPAPGYVIGRVIVEPERVEVIGAESRLGELAGAATEPVSVEGASTSLRDRVAIGVNEPGLRMEKPQEATVTVTIMPVPAEHVVERVMVEPRNLAATLRAGVLPRHVQVGVRATGRQVLADLTPGTVPAFVDLAGLGTGRYNLPVRIDSGREFGITRIEPATVEVIITHQSDASSKTEQRKRMVSDPKFR